MNLTRMTVMDHQEGRRRQKRQGEVGPHKSTKSTESADQQHDHQWRLRPIIKPSIVAGLAREKAPTAIVQNKLLFMTTKIYVDNLATATTENELTELFSAYGNVADIKIAVDWNSQKPGGFGFVTMLTPEGARAAIQALNGKATGTGILSVSEAWPLQVHPRSANGRRSLRRSSSHLY